jgi:hypothetical protein
MFGLGLSEFAVVLVVAALSSAVVAIPAARICRRIGFSPWLGIAAIIPIANLALLWFIAVAEWPARARTTQGS